MKPLNELERFIETESIPDSEFRNRLLDSYSKGGIGLRFAKELLKEYVAPTEPYQEDSEESDD